MWIILPLWLTPVLAGATLPVVDETPGKPDEWGFRPREREESMVTPPGFSWRPQKNASSYVLQVSRDAAFSNIEYEADQIAFNVHCPSTVLAPGKFVWRFRYVNDRGEFSRWSRNREFNIGAKASEFPLPGRNELLRQIPKQHPRLFVRPEDLPRLRELAKEELLPIYRELVARSEQLLRKPPPTQEPPLYPPDVKRLDERWREIWWGNRVYTVNVLNSAATLGFTYLLGQNEACGQLARRLLLEAADWDPEGSTGYRYNDEAGMPYAYYFSRTYTFIQDLLTDEEREKCRAVMKVRGEEMYQHLHPRHLWRPYSSHSNRAWHFLGEVGIAFLGEIEGAEDWVWFAMNVFANVYPVWSDADGGWHEGVSYWRSYLGRFTWWADVMKTAMGVDAYRKPYFSKAGYWPIYLQPPGTQAGGFGDLAFAKDAQGNADLTRILAVQAGNPYWQWYVEALDRSYTPRTYIDFIRGALPTVEAKPPDDLPASRVFRGVGQAVLNTDLVEARNNVSMIFKASPFGTQSHGFEAQNAFQLYVYGKPLLIRTGRRDIHGSQHHREWMWETKSVNSILVDGQGQIRHSPGAAARITRFHAGQTIDYVQGDAGEAYGDRLEGFTRGIVFIKPDVIVIFDRLEVPSPATFQWLLHAPAEFKAIDQHNLFARNDNAACRVDFLVPTDLKITQTDQFDPPPRSRVKLKQYHLTAETAHKTGRQNFVTVIHPYSISEALPKSASVQEVAGGYVVRVPLEDGRAVLLLRSAKGQDFEADGIEAAGDVTVVRFDGAGRVSERFPTLTE